MPGQKHRKTLLLVDDDYQLRLLLTIVLGNMGYEVVVAEDGFSALRKLREITPSVILSDLNMPGMSGFEFLSVVRRRFHDVLVIAMSGAYEGKEVPVGVAADAFYEKGTDLDNLLALLKPGLNSERSYAHAPHKTPVWVAQEDIDIDGRPYVTISCPECLRIYRQLSDATCPDSLQESRCAHCSNKITFAIVEHHEQRFLATDTSDQQLAGQLR